MQRPSLPRGGCCGGGGASGREVPHQAWEPLPPSPPLGSLIPAAFSYPGNPLDARFESKAGGPGSDTPGSNLALCHWECHQGVGLGGW